MDVLDRMGNKGHPEEDYLERYVMKTCSERESNAIEEHLLVCEHCRARLYAAEEWVSLMKTALPLGPNRLRIPRWRESIGQLFTRPMTIAAGCAAMVTIMLSASLLLRETPLEEQWVTLAATRGEQPDPTVDSHKLLRLRLDTTDLVEPMEGQIVDAIGAPVWTQLITPSSPDIKLDRTLQPGKYWVRINSREGGHRNLREFPLSIR